MLLCVNNTLLARSASKRIGLIGKWMEELF